MQDTTPASPIDLLTELHTSARRLVKQLEGTKHGPTASVVAQRRADVERMLPVIERFLDWTQRRLLVELLVPSIEGRHVAYEDDKVRVEWHVPDTKPKLLSVDKDLLVSSIAARFAMTEREAEAFVQDTCVVSFAEPTLIVMPKD